jgi:hypothetical protein
MTVDGGVKIVQIKPRHSVPLDVGSEPTERAVHPQVADPADELSSLIQVKGPLLRGTDRGKFHPAKATLSLFVRCVAAAASF